MPPWKPEPGYGDFANSRRLSNSDISLIQQWVDQGAVEGAKTGPPVPPHWPQGWQIGQPDLVLTMPEPYLLKNSGSDELRTFVIPVPITERRFIRGVEFRTGGSAAIHHANIKIDKTSLSRRLENGNPRRGFEGGGSREAKFPDGHFLGWTPGQSPQMSPDGSGWQLDPGSDLVLELHLTPTGKPESVQAGVGLVFAADVEPRTHAMLRLGRQSIDIPAGEPSYISSDSYTLPVDVDLLAIQPHAHYLAREIKATARLPTGAIEPLIWIRSWDFKWQDVYRYVWPVRLPRGTTISMQYLYDNSAANPMNPNRPPHRVTFGQTTASEMGDLWLEVMMRNENDRGVLDRDVALKMLKQDTEGDEKILEIDPQDARTHADLATCYLEVGRFEDAIAELRRSIALDPASPGVHYDLGSILLDERRLEAAYTEFALASSLKPGFSESQNNLGVIRQLEGRLVEAKDWYERAVRANPENAQAQYNLGQALAVEGRTRDAIAHYERALLANPNDAASHTSLATALAAEHRLEEAIAHYERALELAPDSASALIDLAWIRATAEGLDVRRPEEAVRLAERASALTGGSNPTVLDTLAVCYQAAGQFDRAISAETTALAVASGSAPLKLVQQIQDHLDRLRRIAR
jgi:tetratricopeptide (TPR) repeat protein